MNVNFNGYGENVATFVADSSLTAAGVPVKITADGTVGKCSANDIFCGICVGLRDGYAAVQLSGYARWTLPPNLRSDIQNLPRRQAAKWLQTLTAGIFLLLIPQRQAQV